MRDIDIDLLEHRKDHRFLLHQKRREQMQR